MNLRNVLLLGALSVLAASCGTRQSDVPTQPPAEDAAHAAAVSDLDAASLPPDVTSLVEATVPGIRIEGAQRKERDGRVYYDVEGAQSDGSPIELDLLQTAGGYEVVEVQRDIPWTEAPENVRAAAAADQNAFEPVRVIESKQTDGSIIYELFAAGAPEKPSLEVRLVDGQAAVLQEEWMH